MQFSKTYTFEDMILQNYNNNKMKHLNVHIKYFYTISICQNYFIITCNKSHALISQIPTEH
jgi:uncharacterized FlaG/YvyC family protein